MRGLLQIPDQGGHRGIWKPSGKLEPRGKPTFAHSGQIGGYFDRGAMFDPAEHSLANTANPVVLVACPCPEGENTGVEGTRNQPEGAMPEPLEVLSASEGQRLSVARSSEIKTE